MTCGNAKISKITRKSKSKNVRAQLYQRLEPTCKQQFSATTVARESVTGKNRQTQKMTLLAASAPLEHNTRSSLCHPNMSLN
jgi:hypothetical protein